MWRHNFNDNSFEKNLKTIKDYEIEINWNKEI